MVQQGPNAQRSSLVFPSANIRAFLHARSKQGLPGLLIFGWSGTIGAIIVAIVVSFLLCGYWYPYWRRADMDIMLVYQPFAMHAGQPRTFFDHPGHLHVVLINLWFSFLHKIG